MPITYPRACPDCGTKINNRSNFARQRKYCGKTTIPFPRKFCESTFKRKDDMVRHVKKFHSEGAKRKAAMNDELERLELLHADKIPRLSIDQQTGGAVSTRGTKRVSEELKHDVKTTKIDEDKPDKSDNLEESPLFQANMDKMGKPKSWKRGKVINQKFTFTLDQRKDAKPEEDLGVEAVRALTDGMDAMMVEMGIDPTKHDLALQIGSKEHFKTGHTGETWFIPADDYVKRLERAQMLLGHVANV